MTGSERLQTVIDTCGHNPHSFALEIGMNKSQLIYAILKGKQNISNKLAAKICARFQEVDYNWLLTGLGTTLEFPTLTKTNVPPQNQNEMIRHLMEKNEELSSQLKTALKTNEYLLGEITELKSKLSSYEIEKRETGTN